jgi:hypothetical protein
METNTTTLVKLPTSDGSELLMFDVGSQDLHRVKKYLHGTPAPHDLDT